MWKLIQAEFQYHWKSISVVYSFILYLGISHLLFEGATWRIVSLASTTILILPMLFVLNSFSREKRFNRILPLPVALRKIGMARLLAPIALATVGLVIPWLIVLLFSPGRATLTMAGRTLLLLGFLVIISSTYPLIFDLEYMFKGTYRKVKFIACFVLLQLFLFVIIGGVYFLQYPLAHQAVSLQDFIYQLNNFPGIIIYGIASIVIGAAIFIADVLVFQRRWSIVE